MLLEKVFNKKSDIWTIGCLLFQLCIGWKPFKDDCDAVRYYRKVKEVPQSVEPPTFAGLAHPLCANLLTTSRRLPATSDNDNDNDATSRKPQASQVRDRQYVASYIHDAACHEHALRIIRISG
jgi:serine/threonine protein kinase